MKLRPHQQKAVDRILEEIDNPFGAKEIILEAPTAYGKSLVLSELAKKIEGTIVILVTFTPLIDQIAEHLKILDVDFSILKANREKEFNENHRVQLVMAQTYYARLDKVSITANVVLMDERHVSYNTRRTESILEKLSPEHIIGVSATPYTATGVKLNNNAELIKTTSVDELTKKKYLTPLKYYVPKWSEEIDYSEIKMSGGDFTGTGIEELISSHKKIESTVAAMNELNAKEKKAIVFCSTIAHCDNVTRALKQNGYLAESYHSKVSKIDSERIMSAFKDNTEDYLSNEDIKFNEPLSQQLFKSEKEIKPRAVKCLVSVSKISIGFDVPDIQLGVLLRKTTVLSLVRQMIGRVMRTHKSKEYGEILDLSQSIAGHGFANEEYEPPNARETFALSREAVAKSKEHLVMIHLPSLIEDDKPQLITRDIYNMKLRELKHEEEIVLKNISNNRFNNIDVSSMKRIFDTTGSVASLIAIGAAIWQMRFGEPISKAGRAYKLSPDWLAEDAIKIFDKYPENHSKWIKSHRTRIRNLISGSSENKELSTLMHKGLYAKNYNGIKFFAKYLEDSYLKEQIELREYMNFSSASEEIIIDEEDIPF